MNPPAVSPPRPQLTGDQFRDLLARVKGGDSDACVPLVEAFEPALRSLVCRQMDGLLRTRLEPEDIMQEVWLELFRNIRKFGDTEPSSFLRWLNRIVGWKIKDSRKHHFSVARRLGARTCHFIGSGDDGVNQLKASVPSPDHSAIASEDEAHCRRCLTRLTRTQRTALVSLANGLTVSQVARAMGLPPGTVSVHIHRGRRRLRELISA